MFVCVPDVRLIEQTHGDGLLCPVLLFFFPSSSLSTRPRCLAFGDGGPPSSLLGSGFGACRSPCPPPPIPDALLSHNLIKPKVPQFFLHLSVLVKKLMPSRKGGP